MECSLVNQYRGALTDGRDHSGVGKRKSKQDTVCADGYRQIGWMDGWGMEAR